MLKRLLTTHLPEKINFERISETFYYGRIKGYPIPLFSLAELASGGALAFIQVASASAIHKILNNPLDILPLSYVTVSNTMKPRNPSRHDPAELGELESSMLSIVWREGSVTAEQVREALDRPLTDSTVRTMLRRLEEKGYIAHSIENRAFVYRPAQSRQRVAGRAVRRILNQLCEGSVETLLVGMVDSKVLDPSELQRLAQRIAQVREQDKRKKED